MNTSTDSNNNGAEIAQTILSQLGGRRFVAMTGAKNLGHTRNGFSCKLGTGAAKRITHMGIELDHGTDTYKVTFHSIRGHNFKIVSEFSLIGAEQLAGLFTSETGFALSL